MTSAHKKSRLLLRGNMPAIDSDTTFLAHYDITENDVIRGVAPSGNVVATLIRDGGYFGGGIAVEESTSNMIVTHQNAMQGISAFFNTATGWNLVNDSNYLSSVVPDSGSIYGKGNVLKVVDNDGNTTTSEYGGVTCNRVLGMVSGNNYTMKIRYKVENYTSGTVAVWSHQQDTAGVLASRSSDYPLPVATFNKGWQEYESTKVQIDGYNSRSIGIGMDKTNLGCTVYVDAIQLENKDKSTSFVDGTRGNGLLIYPNDDIIFKDGTISMWLYCKKMTSASNPVFSNGKSESNQQAFDLLLGDNGSNGRFYFRRYSPAYSGGSKQLTYDLPSSIVGKWTHVVCVWENRKSMAMYINGAKIKDLSDDIRMEDFEGYFAIGSGFRSNPNIIVDELRVDKIRRTDEEIEEWYRATVPFYPKGIYRLAY